MTTDPTLSLTPDPDLPGSYMPEPVTGETAHECPDAPTPEEVASGELVADVLAGPDQHLAQAQAQLEAMQAEDPQRNVAKAIDKIGQALYWLGQDAAREA